MAKILRLILILISISQVYSKSFKKREIDTSRRLNHIQPALQGARREESENVKRRHTFFELGKHVDIENSIKKPPLGGLEGYNNDNINNFRYKRQNNNYNTDYNNLNNVFVNDAYNNTVRNQGYNDYNFQSKRNNIYVNNNVNYNINTATNNNYKFNNSEYNNYKVPLATVSPNTYHSTSKYLNSHGNNNYKTTTETLYPFGYYIKNNIPNNNYNNATTETYTGDYNWNNLYGGKNNNNNTYENSVINSSSIVWNVRSTTDLTNPGVRVVGPSKASVINYQTTTAKVISLSKFFNRSNSKGRKLRRRKTTTGAPKVVSSCIMFCTGSAGCPQDKILVGGFCVEDKKDTVDYDYYDVY